MLRGAFLALFVALVFGSPPATGAPSRVEVKATDDAVAPGTCPASNSFGFPTGGNCFIPDVVQITAGDTVVWKSVGKRPHDIVADDQSFKSGGYVYPGDSWSWTFTRPGEYPYYCSLHGDRGGVGHAGKVIVTAKGAAAPKASGDTARGTSAARPGAGAPVADVAPSLPTFVATKLALNVHTVRETPATEHATGAPLPATFLGGILIGLLFLAAWRFATGGKT